MIGIAIRIIKVLLRQIRSALLTGNIEWFGAARGTSTVTSSVQPTASGAIQRIPTTTSVFVAPSHLSYEKAIHE